MCRGPKCLSLYEWLDENETYRLGEIFYSFGHHLIWGPVNFLIWLIAGGTSYFPEMQCKPEENIEIEDSIPPELDPFGNLA